MQDRLIGTTLSDRYRLDALLGRGGMGRVYRARDLRLDRDVALKVLAEDIVHDEGMAGRFVREAKVLARLSHKHVLQVFDHGETEDGRLFLVTELLRGQSLGDVLREQDSRRLSPRATAQLLIQIATGLDRVHADGVIHRDLKPANIFLESDDGVPHAKILDFGIARRLSAGTSDTGLVGTAAYMSPEQIRAERDIDPRTDLYSLGIIAYECLTGRPPFVDEAFMNVALAHLNTPPAPLAQAFPVGGLADELRVLVEQMLAKLPADRPTGAREVRRRLEAMVAAGRLAGDALEAPGEDTTKKPGEWVPTPTPQVRAMASRTGELVAPRQMRAIARWPWVAGSGALVVTAALVIAWASAQVRAPVVTPLVDPVVTRPQLVAPAPVPQAPAVDVDAGLGLDSGPMVADAALARPPVRPPSPTAGPAARRRDGGVATPAPVADGVVVVDARDATDGSKLDAEIQVSGRSGRWYPGQEIRLPPGRHVLIVRRKGEYLQVREKAVTVEADAKTVVPIVLE